MMRILDLTQGIAGPFATLLLAESGADVIKVEPPETGDYLRTSSADGDVQFDFLNRRKQSLTLNLKTRRGRALFLELASKSDAVLESFRPGTIARLGLSYGALCKANPDIVLTSISNFGQRGPRRDWEASELVLQMMGGVAESTGETGGPPVQLGGYQAGHIAGLNAATATAAAVQAVWTGIERGVHIDISIQETLSPHWVRHIQTYIYSGREPARGAGPQVSLGFPGVARAKDGYIYLLALRAEWESFARFLGMEESIAREWSDRGRRDTRWHEIDTQFRTAVAQRGREDWMADGNERGYTFAPIADAPDVLTNRHFEARGFFAPAEVGGATVPSPGLPFAFAAAPARPNRAPALGEDTDAICTDLLGLSGDEIIALRQKRVI